MPQSFYLHDARYAERDAARLTDVAWHIGASYWLVSRGDFGLDGSIAHAILRERQMQILAKAAAVYRSPDGAVALYDVQGLWDAQAEAPTPSQ